MIETPMLFPDDPQVPHDHEQRVRALELDASFIVRAPAGSGKTDLLTRRFLKLLSNVNEPEEILAITFTRAATAEMRARVLHHLEKAAQSGFAQADEDERLTLARTALANSQARGWRLLEQPHRLNIETIDSLCLRIAHGQPRLARLGGQLIPTEHGAVLYALAARRTLGHLGGANAAMNEALQNLLAMRDNNLANCETLIAGMLGQRDQWLRVFPLTENADWDTVRSHLQQPFRNEVRRVLGQAHDLLTATPLLAERLLELANFACANGNSKVAALAGLKTLPSPDFMSREHWCCLSDFLLTGDGEWRKRVQAPEGFPSGAEHKPNKDAMNDLLCRFTQMPELLHALRAARELPLTMYDEHQWETLRHLFTTLRYAAAELRIIFAEQNLLDFTELGIAAREVLSNEEAGPDRLLALSGNIHHLLIDEFQDTSRSQHELVELLVQAWDEGDGRTCFMVGDPMQSIYMFRQAEVELFYQMERSGIVPNQRGIQLSTNFRSHAGLTDRWNDIFAAVFPSGNSDGYDSIPFSPSFASEPALPGESVHVYPQVIGPAETRPTPEEKKQAQSSEAKQVLKIIERHMPTIERAQANGEEYRVAVLVRARQHLAEIVDLLREHGIPFRAVELETLAERQELLDLLSLTRALLHPMDRIAWLSVLRAPWCGLTLLDLHRLTGSDDPQWKRVPVLKIVEDHLLLLDAGAQARAAHTIGVLKHALAARFSGLHATSFSQWIERTWRGLGGAQCVDAAGYENALVYFSMLDSVSPDGIACLTEDFDAEFTRLYAQPDPAVSERAGVQIMTIHKAKGLGFDVVIVPGLERKPASDKQSLIVSLERTNAEGDSELLVAPIGFRGGEKHPTYAWVQKQRERRVDEERKRLLYVACTRARKELHLLGTATQTKSGLTPGDSKSLLTVAWPAIREEFAAASQAAHPKTEKVIEFPQMQKPSALEIAAGVEHTSGLRLRRLREIPQCSPELKNVTVKSRYFSSASGEEKFVRPEGSRHARVIGNTVHALLDALSRGAQFMELKHRSRLLLREAAFSEKVLEDAVQEVMSAIENCVRDSHGAWILHQRAGAKSEPSWTGWFEGHLRTLRADRVFTAGAEPGSEGSSYIWVIDYKMSAPAGEDIEVFLDRQRDFYKPQLMRYADALRLAQDDFLPIRLGLYYPRIGRLDWWDAS